MKGPKETRFTDRLSTAAKAREAMLARAKARSPQNDPEFAARQAVRMEAEAARKARLEAREAERRAEAERIAAEKAAVEAARQDALRREEGEKAAAKKAPGAPTLEALEAAHGEIKRIGELRVELKRGAGKPRRQFVAPEVPKEIVAAVTAIPKGDGAYTTRACATTLGAVEVAKSAISYGPGPVSAGACAAADVAAVVALGSRLSAMLYRLT